MAGITTPWGGHYMLPAFLGCVHWALGNDEVFTAFRDETGCVNIPGKSVDSDIELMKRFSDWVAERLFGKPEDLGGDLK